MATIFEHSQILSAFCIFSPLKKVWESSITKITAPPCHHVQGWENVSRDSFTCQLWEIQCVNKRESKCLKFFWTLTHPFLSAVENKIWKFEQKMNTASKQRRQQLMLILWDQHLKVGRNATQLETQVKMLNSRPKERSPKIKFGASC